MLLVFTIKMHLSHRFTADVHIPLGFIGQVHHRSRAISSVFSVVFHTTCSFTTVFIIVNKPASVVRQNKWKIF